MLVRNTSILVGDYPMQRPVGASLRDRERPGKMPVFGAGASESRTSRLLGVQGRLRRVDRRWWRRWAELGRLLPTLRLLSHDLPGKPLDDDAEECPAGRSPRRVPGRDEGIGQPARARDRAR